MEYLEEAFPDQGFSLRPDDLILRAKMRLALPKADSLFHAFYPINARRNYDEVEFKKLQECL